MGSQTGCNKVVPPEHCSPKRRKRPEIGHFRPSFEEKQDYVCFAYPFILDVNLITADLKKIFHGTGIFCVQHDVLVCEVLQSIPVDP